MRAYRLRLSNNIPFKPKHEPAAVRTKAYRLRGGEELRKKSLITAKQYRQVIRKKIITHYGNGKCSCVNCGESRLACLSIDHIKGDGNKHIKLIKGNLYNWLIKNNFPSGFQTLCMNCQFIKREENRECYRWCNKVATNVQQKEDQVTIFGGILDEVTSLI